ncbi:MAG: sodium-dependent transporter [Pseudomonadota bacterium]
MSTQSGTSSSGRSSLHGQWSSRLAFILAVTGSAVGLGNIWKFPYVAGDNGGGAFVLIYLLCCVLVGLPIMMSEIIIGRRGRRNPIETMTLLGEEEGSSRRWGLVGLMGVVAGVLILSYYSVIAGWSLDYVIESLTGAFHKQDAEGVAAVFSGLTGSWWRVLMWHSIFMLLSVLVVARGVEKGLEKAVKFMVPGLLALMLVLLVYSMTTGYFFAGAKFLLTPDFSKVTLESVLLALGQAFFSLSIGMGAVMAYGAYLPQNTSIASASITVVIADTSIALLSALVIFPIVFANGLDTAQGPGLVFVTLPLAFGGMPAGVIFGTLFFVLLSFAALTSAIGLMEPAVAWIVEKFGVTRRGAATVVGIGVWVVGIGSVLSFNVWSGVSVGRGTFFDNVDYLTSNIMLPLGGVLITIFAGWIMSANSTSSELGTNGTVFKLWRFLARFVAPVGVIIVLLNGTGIWDWFKAQLGG